MEQYRRSRDMTPGRLELAVNPPWLPGRPRTRTDRFCYTALVRPTNKLSPSSLLGLNVADLRAAIWIVSPVLGFRPCRAALSFTVKLPKPLRSTRSPDRKALPISPRRESATASTSLLGRSEAPATASMSCCFVISSILAAAGHFQTSGFRPCRMLLGSACSWQFFPSTPGRYSMALFRSCSFIVRAGLKQRRFSRGWPEPADRFWPMGGDAVSTL